MDVERQRIAEVLDVHGSLWRALVELQARSARSSRSRGLPSMRERLAARARRRRRLPRASRATLLRDPEQRSGCSELQDQQFDAWTRRLGRSGAAAGHDARRRCSRRAKPISRRSTRCWPSSTSASAQLWDDAGGITDPAPRSCSSRIVSGIAVVRHGGRWRS